MIRGIIRQTDINGMLKCKFNQTIHKLTSSATIFRPVIQIQYQSMRRIFFFKLRPNGPFKPIDSIGKAVENDVSLHIDSLDELKIVLTSFKTAKKIRIAFRLTPEFGDDASPVWSKFGLSTSNGELNQALQMIKGTNLSLEGLHMHVGTNLTTPDIYGSIAQALTNTACRIRSFLKHELRYIDIGGGFSARSGAVPSMAHPEEWTPISPKAIIKKITPSLDCFDPEKRISVVSEPGRIIAEKAMSLLTRVVSIKKRDRRLQIILDAGTNILPTAYYTRHPICFPGKERETREETADFHGPLCTQYDVIALETAVPKLVPGDLVLIHGAGAYTYSFSSQFVGPRPPVVLVSEERNTFEPIREKEPEDILWKYDRMPNL